MEWLQTNWVWLLLALGAAWFLFRRGGCGMGSNPGGQRRDTAQDPSAPRQEDAAGVLHDSPRRDVEATRAHRHRGC